MDPAQVSAKPPGAPERRVKTAVRLAESVKSREFLVKLHPTPERPEKRLSVEGMMAKKEAEAQFRQEAGE